MTSAKTSMLVGDSSEVIPLGTYAWPRSETRQTLGHLIEKVKQGLSSQWAEEAVDVDRLETVSDSAIKRSVRGALTSILLDMIEQEYRDWAFAGSGKRSHRLFVYPPMNEDLLSAWAKRVGLPIFDATSPLKDVLSAPCIVVPALQAHFSRSPDQIAQFFDLLSTLSNYQGRLLVGCNSWALRFLNQFDDIRLILGKGHTFPAFDAGALADVLENAIDDPAAYISVRSGDCIFKRDDENAPSDPFLESLVNLSLGHPWVAVEMFFQGMSEAQDDNSEKGDAQVWVQLPKTCSLPQLGKSALLLALHALLIHGTREIAKLEALMPQRLPAGVWSELERSGFVDLKDGQVSCAIRNYPSARSELSAAGFNLDKL